MKIVATMAVRNEDWILGFSARAVLMWADELVIRDHCSTDRSRMIEAKIAEEFPDRVSVLLDDNPVWEEMRHRQEMLDEARRRGATHIAVVDADEVVSANLLGNVRQMVADAGQRLLTLPWVCIRGGESANQYIRAGVWADQQVSTVFQDAPHLHWSSAGRGGYDFHHRQPMGGYLPPYHPIQGVSTGGLMHFQFAGWRRLRAKQALYKMTEVLRWPGREPVEVVDRRYNVAVYGQETATDQGPPLADTPIGWWTRYEHLRGHMRIHADPWQEAECYRLLKEHGPKPFAGLDLFGIGDDTYRHGDGN